MSERTPANELSGGVPAEEGTPAPPARRARLVRGAWQRVREVACRPPTGGAGSVPSRAGRCIERDCMRRPGWF